MKHGKRELILYFDRYPLLAHLLLSSTQGRVLCQSHTKEVQMMPVRMKRPSLGVAALAIAGGLVGLLGASAANADLIETINQPNAALSGFTPGYVSLDIHW